MSAPNLSQWPRPAAALVVQNGLAKLVPITVVDFYPRKPS